MAALLDPGLGRRKGKCLRGPPRKRGRVHEERWCSKNGAAANGAPMTTFVSTLDRGASVPRLNKALWARGFTSMPCIILVGLDGASDLEI